VREGGRERGREGEGRTAERKEKKCGERERGS